MNQLCASRSMSGALLLTALCCLVSALPARAQEDARRATPPPGKALVFVYRNDRVPLAAQVPVVVNTDLLGELANGTFVTATVSPGNTYLRIGDRVLSTLYFVAAANQRYFVRVEATYGLSLVRTEVQLVSETEGRSTLEQSRFVGGAPSALGAVPRPPQPSIAPAQSPAKPSIVAAPPPPPPPAPSVAPAPAKAQPAPEPVVSAPMERGRESGFALIASVGSFKMATGDQVVAGLPSTFDTSSKSVFGIEAEWRFGSGFAVGGEIFSYKNDLVSTAANPNAEQAVLAVMVNGKYYFRATSWLYPFVGVGVGLASASYSGGLSGDADGLAYQGLAGMEFRFKPVGIYVQYKNLSAKTGDTGNEVKVGGSGVFAGVSISF
jgi:opacity protein-like surface antigen